ncbi:MAG: hypothetical protein VX322_06480 [Actinomycetota bacterium]|nr:hypothetical protein [Actinomycetota bacterium]
MTSAFSVSAPGSSANLGAGFDVLGLAVDLRAEVGLGDAPQGAQTIDKHHPAAIAYKRLGGSLQLWSRSQLPMGGGLGYSGATRAAGAMLALVERENSPAVATEAAAREEVFAVVAELEGHPDNAGASVYGGLIAASVDRVARLPIEQDWVLLIWIPDSTTSTDKSRTQLDAVVRRVDAVANLAAITHFIAGISAGDESLVRAGVNDRLHQTQRLADVPGSANALKLMQESGAIAAWLSGSGPTVAGFYHRGETEAAEQLLAGGQIRIVDIDRHGVISF